MRALLLAGVMMVACGPGRTGVNGGGGGSGGSGGVGCSAQDFSATISASCKSLNPPSAPVTCAYAGSDIASCIGNLTDEAGRACQEGCNQELSDWLHCIQQAGLLCSKSAADQACGVERGQLNVCCRGCDSQDF